MKAIYQIPLIPQDLRQEENIIQIADVLDHLNNVIDDVFTKLNTRIDANMKRARMIQNRINICSDKVDKLVGTNKATRVMCSAKYPAMESHTNVESIFKETTRGEIVRTPRDINTKPAMYSEKEIQDKLEFYHVKVNSQDPVQSIFESHLPRYHESPPAELRAVGGLMVYGSEELAYGSGSRVGGVNVQAAKEATERGPPSPLHEPPATVATRETQSRGQHLYLYSPNMEEVPTMDMPQDLPHLSGIAGDMRFQLESEPTIAPSARGQGLTSSPMFVVEEKQDQTPVVLPQKEQTPPIVPQAVEKPRTEESVGEKTSLQLVIPTPPSHSAPPPPPLPPTAALEETDSRVSSKSSTTKRTEPLSTPVDNRANLMEAIRNAGGSGKARLRSVTTAATALKKDNTGKATSAGGGDLMADLHAKLSMRRKGISGARQGAAEGTILAALSAIIPPPPDADAQSNSEVSSTEDDWE